MRKPKPDWRRVKLHRSYTVEEVSRTLGVSKGTVRRWVKTGLPVLTDQKPMLVLGADLIEFGKARRVPKQKCAPNECYCVKCRVPREPFDRLAEYVPINATSGNLRGLCPACGTLMHKRIAMARIPDLKAFLDVSVPQAETDLMDSVELSPNHHLEREHPDHG